MSPVVICRPRELLSSLSRACPSKVRYQTALFPLRALVGLPAQGCPTTAHHVSRAIRGREKVDAVHRRRGTKRKKRLDLRELYHRRRSLIPDRRCPRTRHQPRARGTVSHFRRETPGRNADLSGHRFGNGRRSQGDAMSCQRSVLCLRRHRPLVTVSALPGKCLELDCLDKTGEGGAAPGSRRSSAGQNAASEGVVARSATPVGTPHLRTVTY